MKSEVVIKRLVMTEISKKMFGRYLSWNLHGQKKNTTKKKKKSYGKGDVLDDLFTVSLCVLADVEDYFFPGSMGTGVATRVCFQVFYP